MTERRRTLHWMAVAPAAFVLLGATCDIEDISGPHRMTLDPGVGVATASFDTTGLGRLSVDLGIENTGGAPATYSVQAQAQTAGNREDEACADADALDRRLLAAAPPDEECIISNGNVPLVRDLGTVYEIEFQETNPGERACLRTRFARRSIFNFYVRGDDVDLRLFNGAGTEILPERVETLSTACTQLDQLFQFDVQATAYTLEIRRGTIENFLLIAEEDCQSRVTVPRTCPGVTSDLREEFIGPVAPGEVAALRVGIGELGIGDQVVVEVSCGSESTGCGGEIETFVGVEQLDCRQDDACAASQNCTADGYCLSQDGALCMATPTAPNPPWPVAAALFAGLMQRRRKR